MWFKVRLTLLVLTLVGIMVYARFAIQSDPKRAAGGEFTGLLLLPLAILLLGLLATLFLRRSSSSRD